MHTAPFAIYIYWRETKGHKSILIREYASKIYDFFNRNTNNPLDRYLEIPVFLFPFIPENIDTLQFKKCQYSLHIIMLDTDMIAYGQDDWKSFITDLYDELQLISPNHQLLPISLTKNSIGFHPILDNLHQIISHETEPQNQQDSIRKFRLLLINIANVVARLLYNSPIPDSKQSNSASLPPLPIQLFISHTKTEGEQLAKDFYAHITNNINIGSFFDSIHMYPGWPFSKQIEGHIKKSVFLAIYTDSYSSRDWCRREFLLAKRYNCPILLVNQFEKGELRTFPYLGNVPHIHFPQEDLEHGETNVFLLDFILSSALRETIRFKHNELKVKMLAGQWDNDDIKVAAYPPELITLVEQDSSPASVFLYPDPPLGSEEIKLLKKIHPKTAFLTPVLLSLMSGHQKDPYNLKGLKVGISLSNPVRRQTSDIQNRGIQDLMVYIIKYLLVSDASLIYAGDLNYKEPQEKESPFNYFRLIIELLKTYQKEYRSETPNYNKRLKAYTFFPGYADLDSNTRAPVANLVALPGPEVEFEQLEKLSASIPGLNIDQKEEIRSYKTEYHKFVWAESLSLMRREMINEEHARICLGGKWIQFRGKMPGLLEEFFIASERKKPIYLIGGYGGVCKDITDALSGKKPKTFDISFFHEEYPEYASFLEGHTENTVNYPQLLQQLHDMGKNNEDFGLNNGLSREENITLFTSRFEIEIVTLILKGLTKIASS